MDNNNNKKYSAGIGVCDLLTIAFVVLKLCKVIDWSWWAVLLPTLIPLGIVILCFVGAIVVDFIEKHV